MKWHRRNNQKDRVQTRCLTVEMARYNTCQRDLQIGRMWDFGGRIRVSLNFEPLWLRGSGVMNIHKGFSRTPKRVRDNAYSSLHDVLEIERKEMTHSGDVLKLSLLPY